MKNKTFYQTNIYWQLLCFVFLAIFVLSLIVGVHSIIEFVNNGFGENTFENIKSIILMVIYSLGVFFWLYAFICVECNNLHFTNEKIYMKKDWGGKLDRIQYYTEIKFVDIESVDIIWTKKNSKGKLIRSRLLSSSVVKPYLSIKNKNGKVFNFFIMHISKKDVIKIINEIRVRMKNVDNDIDIIKEEEALLKINKKIQIDI